MMDSYISESGKYLFLLKLQMIDSAHEYVKVMHNA